MMYIIIVTYATKHLYSQPLLPDFGGMTRQARDLWATQAPGVKVIIMLFNSYGSARRGDGMDLSPENSGLGA